MSAFFGQLEIYGGTDFEQNKIEAWTSDRFGGGADGEAQVGRHELARTQPQYRRPLIGVSRAAR
jgi:hypothetical protein